MVLTKQDLSSITTIVREESKKIVQEETRKIVQDETRKIVNGQSAMKSELLGEIGKVRKEMNKGFDKLEVRVKKVEVKVASI